MRNKTILSLTFTALFAALISAGAIIAIPIGPVPIALQNLFTLLSGMVLGPLLGTAAVALFIAAGAVGLPVFANTSAGLARIMGPTGGYMLGYLLGAVAAGLILGFPRPGVDTPVKIPLWRLIVAAAAGMLVVYVPGLLRLKLYLGINWPQTFTTGFVPFLIGDALKAALAVLITPRLRRIATQLLER
jgi:biotin transport system substrate-specific component